DRNHSVTALALEFIRGSVITGKKRELRSASFANLFSKLEISTRFFDPFDPWVAAQLDNGIKLKTHDGAARNIVEKNRNLHLVRHGGKVLDHPSLRRFVVIGDNHQE